jgi:hypothetical protein
VEEPELTEIDPELVDVACPDIDNREPLTPATPALALESSTLPEELLKPRPESNDK